MNNRLDETASGGGIKPSARLSKKDRKRILIIGIGAPFGGVESYILGLVDLFGEKAQLFALCGLPELAARLRRANVKVFRIPVVRSPGGSLILFQLSNLVRLIVAFAILPVLVLRYRIDIVQVNGYYESLLVLPARLLGCAIVRTSHSSSEIDRYRWYREPTKYFPRLAAMHLLKLATKVICVSEAVGKDVLQNVPADKVVVIPNWVPEVPVAKTEPESLSPPIKLLYVGRLEQYKGLHLLLEAIRGMKGLHLTVVGVGSYREELERLAQGLDVEFKGFCANTAPFYEEADIFINPSLGPEGLPIVSLESMAHGLPCIFSALPVHREISDNGVASLLFQVGDANDLRAKLLRLVEDQSMRRSLSQRARNIIHERYSPDAARRAYTRAFELREEYST
ncbi:glycosyl transferase group 1 [Acidisarcina polymorpha]|uniref:Glycosyl transferase group 1 n=1 Tax=Acidisarcina polymorpha TaxID=2211140 RepID=A0A2Z5G3M8_9BACT|nr:glycosyltransferase family 4 protein [Acidisarcina polymorpha]AXC13679.1 glycosyl transferase group 1 [Acidisarcina polymorpha]